MHKKRRTVKHSPHKSQKLNTNNRNQNKNFMQMMHEMQLDHDPDIAPIAIIL